MFIQEYLLLYWVALTCYSNKYIKYMLFYGNGLVNWHGLPNIGHIRVKRGR